jgi:hypothetical protein
MPVSTGEDLIGDPRILVTTEPLQVAPMPGGRWWGGRARRWPMRDLVSPRFWRQPRLPATAVVACRADIGSSPPALRMTWIGGEDVVTR